MGDRTTRIALAALLVLCTMWFLAGEDDLGRPTDRPRGDGEYYYVYLPSMWLDGDLDLANQYHAGHNPYQTRKTATGRPGNFFGIGPALFESPWFLLGH